MKKGSRVKKMLWIVSAVVVIILTIIAGKPIRDGIEDAKLTAKEAADQAIQESKKQEIDGVRFYVNDSIGKNDITWRREVLEAVPPKESMGWLKEKRAVATQQEALEYARYILAQRKEIGDPENEQLTEIIQLKKDNLWMFIYWVVDSEGGIGGYIVDGNNGSILKGWVEE